MNDLIEDEITAVREGHRLAEEHLIMPSLIEEAKDGMAST